uniref:F-box domain-containing protein n=1 Tax=Caenorhabditis tropicalis TaxID=1561998 RepID=A0A1I7V4F5_9PELO
MDTEVSAKVFQNPIILERILSSVLDENNTIPNQCLRFVSKSFDRGYLTLLRKRNREIRMEENPLFRGFIFVNYEKVDIMKLASYFKFLNSVVKLNVRNIVVDRTENFEKAFRKPIHNSLLKGLIRDNYNSIEKLVGLMDLCDGCSDCIRMSETCQEYGPIYPSFFEKYVAPRHFDNLIVTEPQLNRISNDLKNLEDLEKRLPSISCRKLTIGFSEWSISYINEEVVKTPMPREMVDMMIEKWKVKTVRINSHYSMKGDNDYILKNREFITPFRLSAPFETTEKSKINFKFDHVELNLAESKKCTRGITTNQDNEYINVIANIRRMFPTDYIKITGVHVYSSTLRELYFVLYQLRETIYIENQSNLRVDVELFTRLNKSHFDRCSSFFADAQFDYDGRVHSCEIEDSPIRRVFQRFEENSFRRGVNLGKRVTYKGKNNNCVINFDVLA